jgi:hypothetical protein
MKARELMVGDLFRINKSGLCIVEDAIIKVTGINSENEATHCVDINDEDNNGGIWCEYLEPIPLTAEILIKSGFADFRKHDEDGMHHFEYCINGMRIDQLADTLFVWICPATDNSILTIKYVHELQHALKLCGIDKNIGL